MDTVEGRGLTCSREALVGHIDTGALPATPSPPADRRDPAGLDFGEEHPLERVRADGRLVL